LNIKISSKNTRYINNSLQKYRKKKMVNSSYFKKNELKAQFLLNNSEKKVPCPHFVGLINQTPTFSVDFRIFTSPCHCEERSDTAPDLVGWGQTFDSLGQNLYQKQVSQPPRRVNIRPSPLGGRTLRWA